MLLEPRPVGLKLPWRSTEGEDPWGPKKGRRKRVLQWWQRGHRTGLGSLRASATPGSCVREGGLDRTLDPQPPTTLGNKTFSH